MLQMLSPCVPLWCDLMIEGIVLCVVLCGTDGLINCCSIRPYLTAQLEEGGYLRTPPMQQADGDLVCVCLVCRYLRLMHNHPVSSSLPFALFLSCPVSRLVFSCRPVTCAQSLMSVWRFPLFPRFVFWGCDGLLYQANSFAFITPADWFDKHDFFFFFLTLYQ